MEDYLRQETERLSRSWMQHEPEWLKNYLVAGVEDPRLNVQSVLTRHFLLRALFGERFDELASHEYRFASVMAWLLRFARQPAACEESLLLRFGLERVADNVEGLEIPGFLQSCFNGLPVDSCGTVVPNYVEQFLGVMEAADTSEMTREWLLDTFGRLWSEVLGTALPAPVNPEQPRISVIEPACGSANDYRYLERYGLASRIDYAGFDLCDRNIENARALFPGTKFEPGNVLEISQPDNAFDYCVVHDLFEHLSLPALRVGVAEVCRVTRVGLCLGFFQMDEIREHVVRPVHEYHWNLLSLGRMKEMFGDHGFDTRAVHIGTFLREHVGCAETHNPYAYTLVVSRVAA
jgi:SAM-dependent methyltransferase